MGEIVSLIQNKIGNYSCVCDLYTGRYCDQDVDECDQDTDFCKNGGTCTVRTPSPPSSYKHKCIHETVSSILTSILLGHRLLSVNIVEEIIVQAFFLLLCF